MKKVDSFYKKEIKYFKEVYSSFKENDDYLDVFFSEYLNTGIKTSIVYNYGKYGIYINEYIYDGDLLKKILVETKEHTKTESSKSEILFEYNNDKGLTKVNRLSLSNGFMKELYPNME